MAVRRSLPPSDAGAGRAMGEANMEVQTRGKACLRKPLTK
jgi:hypothetical protein